MSSSKASSSTKRVLPTRRDTSNSDALRQKSIEDDLPHDGDSIPDLADMDFIWSSTAEATQHEGDNFTNDVQENDSDEEMDWEEVAVDTSGPLQQVEDSESMAESRGFEITLDLPEKPKTPRQKEGPKGLSPVDRMIRLESHKLHTICLLANAAIRNKWINHSLLHARLMSLTPLHLQNAFQIINKKTQPEVIRRARMFATAITELTEWWHSQFEIEEGLGIKSRTFAEAELLRQTQERKRKGKSKARAESDDSEDEITDDLIKTPKSLMKHALMWRGSRDTSAQLFTALCRALAIPARLVVSLQAVPWKASVGKKTGQSQGKGDQAHPSPSTDGGSNPRKFPGLGRTVSGAPAAAIGKAAPVIRLRKTKVKGRTLGGPRRKAHLLPPPQGWPPVFWTEVFSRSEGRWIPVDPSRNLVNRKKLLEPPAHDPNNRMTYVLAFEEDGYARDVTPRYAQRFTEKTTKIRMAGKAAGKKQWWEKVMSFLTRPYRLNRDDLEDNELHHSQMIEGMPTAMAGFKDHPMYALERHMKRDEVIHPKRGIGKFRGEPVYARSCVQAVKTSENWMRQGRRILEGQQPLKQVKQRATTLHRKRAIELANAEGGESMQGAYAEWQTELFVPDPIVDGKIPKNDFGNIDLYVPSMLPAGGVHVPHKGVAKIARELGIDYAEAVTGFEFKKGRAFAVITGVVIAADNEQTLLDAYWESAQAAEEKERAKRDERVIKRWTKLVQGLRIRKRMQEEYGRDDRPAAAGVDGPTEPEVDDTTGGYFTQYDRVIQPFHLPKSLHVVPMDPGQSGNNVIDDGNPPDLLLNDQINVDGDLDEEMPDATSTVPPQIDSERAPRTMRELAEEAEAYGNDRENTEDGVSESFEDSPKAKSVKKPPQRRDGLRSGSTSTPTRASRKRGRDSITSQLNGGLNVRRRDAAPRTSSDADPPALGRTLRPRKSKTTDQLRLELESEAAIKRAIEEDSD